jgi:spore maturation protein SpmB
MLDIYEKIGPDSFEGLFSTFIHTISDSSIYIIAFYFGAVEIKKYKNVISFGVILNILGYLLSILIIYFLFV